MGPQILLAEHLTKRFGSFVAVDRVDFSLHEGEVVGIVGPNGAGKTTFFNLVTGYHTPDEGRVLFLGQDVTRASPRRRVELGLVRTFQLASTFDALPVVDNLILALFSRLHSGSDVRRLLATPRRRYYDDPRVQDALEQFHLSARRDRVVRHLSLGEKRRLEIAMAVLSNPRVLMLDEPLAGLSELEIHQVMDVLRSQVGRRSLVVVEHKVSHLLGFVQRLMVMHEGRVIAEGSPEECLKDPEVRRSYWRVGAESA
ncbi:MAG: ABC transporter ATP-binding protein [Armatimonadota bacterium]|nr:ABC transporter ATP-binding protein [Armatimonadota bacterium]MDW8157099.1 ABC transporter ATP-binding protein [Armatimonadota bacterium]